MYEIYIKLFENKDIIVNWSSGLLSSSIHIMPNLIYIEYLGGTMAPRGPWEDPPLIARPT